MRDHSPAGHVPRSQRQLPPIPQQQLSTQDSMDDENYEIMDTSVHQLNFFKIFIDHTAVETKKTRNATAA